MNFERVRITEQASGVERRALEITKAILLALLFLQLTTVYNSGIIIMATHLLRKKSRMI